MLMNKEQMKTVITTAGYRVFDEAIRLIVRTRSDEYVVAIPYSSDDEMFESHFVNSILND